MREVPAPSPLLGRIVQSHSGALGFGGCLSNSASYFVEKVKISVTPISYQRATSERFASLVGLACPISVDFFFLLARVIEWSNN